MKTLALLLSLLVTACAAGPTFTPPAAPSADRYTSEPLPEVSLETQPHEVAAALPEPAWWTQFHSAELDATVRTALAGNRSLAGAQATLAQAREMLAASGGARAPAVSLDSGTGRQKYGAAFLGPNAFPPFTYFSVGANISYVLDYTGGVRRSIEQERALAEVQQHQLDAAHLALTGNVVLQALAIASARARIRASESILTEDARNLDLVRTALKEGSVARVDLLSAESQLADDQTLLPPLRQELSQARHALAVLVGQAPGNWSPPDFELKAFEQSPALALTVPSELARHRPDIRSDEARLHAATAAVGVATANLYPQIKLTGSLGKQSLTVDTLFDHQSTAFGLVGNLTAPIFNGGRLRAERRASLAAMQAALAKYEQTVLVAFAQVADVLAALEHDAEQSAAQQRALDAAEASLALTRESYSAGNVGVLQILDAERLVQRARVGVARARAQRLQDTVELIVGLGGDTPTAAN